ncbi:MAG: DUF115 domain-containing protein [Spirochaetales bacterium]|nr:DUF115 domain-containing protein [Spirochaetales bacterium]
MYNNSSILERNLLSLSLQNKELAVELTKAELSSVVSFKESRNNKSIIPVINRSNRDYALHSTFDPQKEGLRYSDSVKGGGYIVVFGLGGGYHIRELLKRNDINGILIIDKDIEILKAILSSIDLSDVLSDPRIFILIDKTSSYIREFLPENYLPAITGNFQTISLRARIDSDKEYFLSIFDTIKEVMDTLSDDYTVQTWFGKKWFLNSLSNLEPAESSTTILRSQRNISIAGAGPSLELYLDELADNKRNTFLISTDTALACLLKNSIKPDLVISIDCQQISYQHFMAGYPKDIPLVLDLASPPLLSRLSNKTLFFTSGHPFSRYVNKNWRQFPFIDTSGGNVTHAAVSLAESLGASNIYIYGADYSYPQGKSYARGTYVYPYFSTRTDRTIPLESNFYKFLYRNENISMIKTDYGFRYITRPMLNYKGRLETFAKKLNANIIPVKGLGVDIDITPKEKVIHEPSIFSAGESRSSWKEFLNIYKQKLKNLTVPDLPPSRYFSSLDYTDKDVWTTLFPVAAVIRKKYRDENIKSSVLLSDVRDWALDAIDQHL